MVKPMIEENHMERDHMEKLYSSKNLLIKYIHMGRLKKIMSLIPKRKNIKILDAGCGEGQLLSMISKKFGSLNLKLYGTDITTISLKSAKKRIKNTKFSLQDLRNLDYKDEFFDIIICTEVIEHIPEYKKVLKELKRVLKKVGTLIISFPNEFLWTISRFFLRRKPIREPGHVNSFSPKKIIKEVNLKVKKRINIPFELPSFLALTRIIVFMK